MSECELPQYYRCAEHTARKIHDCCECSAPIVPGEKYLQINACWENRPGVYRQHLLCQAACETVRDSGMNDDECLAFGELYEFWRTDSGGPYHSTELPARQKLWVMMLGILRRERKHANAIERS